MSDTGKNGGGIRRRRTRQFKVPLVLVLPPFFSFSRLDFWLVPLSTIGLDLTPWTGRFAYNELDLLFLVTLSSGWLSMERAEPTIYTRPRR